MTRRAGPAARSPGPYVSGGKHLAGAAPEPRSDPPMSAVTGNGARYFPPLEALELAAKAVPAE
ncbi:MAG TPA: hypothetical protein VGB96_18225, partial [Archangium sp.]